VASQIKIGLKFLREIKLKIFFFLSGDESNWVDILNDELGDATPRYKMHLWFFK
jgi:hypothetical protein